MFVFTDTQEVCNASFLVCCTPTICWNYGWMGFNYRLTISQPTLKEPSPTSFRWTQWTKLRPSQNIFALVIEVWCLAFVSLLGVSRSGGGGGGEPKIVSEFRNILHKNPNYLGGESTNSGPVGTHGNVPWYWEISHLPPKNSKHLYTVVPWPFQHMSAKLCILLQFLFNDTMNMCQPSCDQNGI